MKILSVSAALIAAGLLVGGPVWAQPSPDKSAAASGQKQRTQDGGSPTTVGPGSAAYKQRTQDGGGPTMVGPGSSAYKQRTQSLSHSDGSAGALKQN
jgi:ABC-type transport system substrate-binding protein